MGSGCTSRFGTCPLRGMSYPSLDSSTGKLQNPFTGSARTPRKTGPASRDPRPGLRGPAASLRPLRAVLGAPLPPRADARSVQRAADDVVAHTGKVLHPAAADQHHRVLLEVVSLAGNVGGDLNPVAKAHAEEHRVGDECICLVWTSD